MKRSYREFLQDILDAITEIEFFLIILALRIFS